MDISSSCLESMELPVIYVKKLGQREILFRNSQKLELFETILHEYESGIEFEQAMIQFGMLSSGDALVRLAFASEKQKMHW